MKSINIITCNNIADYFINKSNEVGSFISNLKLQKLVYFAQAWHLAINKRPLFKEDFEAWIHGPVIPSLYQNYKKFGYTPIAQRIKKINFYKPEIAEFLDKICEVYFPMDALELELITHKETPWIEARNGLAPDARCNNVIEKEKIHKYYEQKL